MSFEGYYEKLCEDGHLTTFDVYYYFKPDKCRCGKEFVWWHIVDVTNGMDEETGEGMPTDFEILSEEKVETCNCCNHTNVIEEVRYKIPDAVGHKGQGWEFEWGEDDAA